MDKLTELTQEQKNFAVDATAAMVIEELAKKYGLDSNHILKDFVTSKTGGLLYDESSKLWWCGPSYIAEMYCKENPDILTQR